MATLALGDTGLAALQELSIKVILSSTQNPLLPDGYSNLPTYSVFTEEKLSLLAKRPSPRQGLLALVTQVSNLKLGSLSAHVVCYAFLKKL